MELPSKVKFGREELAQNWEKELKRPTFPVKIMGEERINKPPKKFHPKWLNKDQKKKHLR